MYKGGLQPLMVLQPLLNYQSLCENNPAPILSRSGCRGYYVAASYHTAKLTNHAAGVSTVRGRLICRKSNANGSQHDKLPNTLNGESWASARWTLTIT